MERAAEENPGLEEYYRELARNWRSLAKAAREMETRGN